MKLCKHLREEIELLNGDRERGRGADDVIAATIVISILASMVFIAIGAL